MKTSEEIKRELAKKRKKIAKLRVEIRTLSEILPNIIKNERSNQRIQKLRARFSGCWLDAGLAGLPERFIIALQNHDKKTKEIAGILGVTPSTARKCLIDALDVICGKHFWDVGIACGFHDLINDAKRRDEQYEKRREEARRTQEIKNAKHLEAYQKTYGNSTAAECYFIFQDTGSESAWLAWRAKRDEGSELVAAGEFE